MRKHLTAQGKSLGYIDGFVHGMADGEAIAIRRPSHLMYQPSRYASEVDYCEAYQQAIGIRMFELNDPVLMLGKYIFPKATILPSESAPAARPMPAGFRREWDLRRK